MKGVYKAFGPFIVEKDAIDKPQNDLLQEVSKLLKLRFRNNAPLRPPQVILVGPPGSGRST